MTVFFEKIYRQILWGGITVVVVFAVVARGAVRTWSIMPVLAAITLLVFLWGWKRAGMQGPEQPIRFGTADLLIGSFALLAVISSIFSIYAHASIYALVRLFAYVGVYYLVRYGFDHTMRQRLLTAVIIFGGLFSAYGVLQYAQVFDRSWWYPQEFLAATFVNHNHCAGFLEMVIPVTIAALLEAKGAGARARLMYIAALICMIAAFVLTQSRGGWISLSVSLAVMAAVLLARKAEIRKNVFILVFLVVAAAAFVYFGRDAVMQRAETIVDTQHEDMSFGTRLMIWRGTVAMIGANPVTGTGVGTFIDGFPRYRPAGLFVKANFAHNDYLNMAAEMGVLAPGIMVAIFAIVIARGFRSVRPYILGCAAGVASLVLHATVDFNFHIPANMLLFVVWCAIIMGGEKRSPADS